MSLRKNCGYAKQAGGTGSVKTIPELALMSGTPQPPEYHAEGDVAIHTRLAIELCPAGCDPDLLWVALLHDIGKPATTRQNEEGRVTAYGHANLGAEMADEILRRIDMPEKRRATNSMDDPSPHLSSFLATQKARGSKQEATKIPG